MNSVMMRAFVDEMEKIAYLPVFGAAGGLLAKKRYDPEGETGVTGPGYGVAYGIPGGAAGALLGHLAGGGPRVIIPAGLAGEGLAGYYGAKHQIKRQKAALRSKDKKNRK